MKFIEDLYELYKNHLTGDEEDVIHIIEGVLKDFRKEDVDDFFNELEVKDKYEMLGVFLYEKFRLKVVEEGVGETLNQDDQKGRFYH